MTRDVYLGIINIVSKVIEIAETSRTRIVGGEENHRSHRKWKCLEEKAEEEEPTKQWLEKEGESSILEAS